MNKYTQKKKHKVSYSRRLEHRLSDPRFRTVVEDFFLKNGIELKFTPIKLLNKIYLKHKICALARAQDLHDLDVRKKIYDYYLSRRHSPTSLPFYMSLSPQIKTRMKDL